MPIVVNGVIEQRYVRKGCAITYAARRKREIIACYKARPLFKKPTLDIAA